MSARWRVALRPTLLFVVAFMLATTPHELVHAIAAYELGFSSTVHHLWVTPDSGNATTTEVAIIAAAGPLFSLVVGICCWALYKRRRERPMALPLFMLAVTEIYMFL